MASKVFVICGHGGTDPYDPGACAGGHTEADLVRKLASRMKALGGSAVQVGDTSVNWYASNWISAGKCPKGVPVIELHMDSAAASAKGGHVIIRAGLAADDIDKACEKFIKGFFPGRSITLSKRSDLANPNRAYNMGVNYRLVECGFISNSGDRKKFTDQMDDLARGLLSAFGVKAGSSSQTTTDKPSGGSTASQSGKSYTVRVTADELNIRKGPGTGYGVAGSIKDKGVYTIVQESDGKGSNAGWGKLKSGAGWISLDFCERTDGKATSAKKSVDEVAREVIRGDWGNGSDRKKRLEAAGYDYDAVQKRVNQLL